MTTRCFSSHLLAVLADHVRLRELAQRPGDEALLPALHHHIAGLPDFSALKFTRYNQYESLILPMQKYLEAAGVDFRFGTEVTNVIFDIRDGRKTATAIECRVNGAGAGHCPHGERPGVRHQRLLHRGDHLRRPGPRPQRGRGGAHQRLLESVKNIARQDPRLRPSGEVLLRHLPRPTGSRLPSPPLDDKILPYITNICKRDPAPGRWSPAASSAVRTPNGC